MFLQYMFLYIANILCKVDSVINVTFNMHAATMKQHFWQRQCLPQVKYINVIVTDANSAY